MCVKYRGKEDKKTTLKFSMKKKANILIVFILSINVVSPLAKANQPTNLASQISEGNCSYLIQIETTCAPSADTTDHISVRFIDSSGNLIIVKHLRNPKLLNSPKYDLKKSAGRENSEFQFKRCSISSFEAKGACMKKSVCALYLKRVGSDDWRPGWVKVLHQEDSGRAVPVSYTFYFRTFLPGNVWYGFDYCHS